MTFFVTALHVLVCVLLIVVVLLQRGKGAEIGAVFGGGAGSTLFGSRGAGTFLSKLTSIAAGVFMLTSFYLAYVAVSSERGSIYDSADTAAPAPTQGATTPATAPAAGGDFVEVPSAEQAPAESDSAAAPAVPDASAAESSGTGNESGNPTQ